jgi:hypothetical protein
MRVQRNHIADFLEQRPSLRPELPKLIANAYGNARLKAADETGLSLDVFAELCEWTVGEMLITDTLSSLQLARPVQPPLGPRISNPKPGPFRIPL